MLPRTTISAGASIHHAPLKTLAMSLLGMRALTSWMKPLAAYSLG